MIIIFVAFKFYQNTPDHPDTTAPTNDSSSAVAGLNITDALQISVNMTVTRPCERLISYSLASFDILSLSAVILEQPLFAIDGTANDNVDETYVVAVVGLGNTTDSVPPVLYYLGANYTANNTMQRLSVLTNSTPALLAYSPVNFVFGPVSDWSVASNAYRRVYI